MTPPGNEIVLTGSCCRGQGAWWQVAALGRMCWTEHHVLQVQQLLICQTDSCNKGVAESLWQLCADECSS